MASPELSLAPVETYTILIDDLKSERYALNKPLEIVFDTWADSSVTAFWAEAGVSGHGDTQDEALEDFKLDG